MVRLSRKDDDGDKVFSEIRVPLAYGPTQKFLARLEQDATLKKALKCHCQECHLSFWDFNMINPEN